MSVSPVYLSLGSNLGDKLSNLQNALDELALREDTSVTSFSSVYETEPYGFHDQPMYYNCAAEVRTSMAPLDFVAACKAIEKKLGRTDAPRYHPRVVDIDLLYYGSQILRLQGISIPHAQVHLRRFVLEPLAEIAPDYVDPVLRQSVRSLLAELQDPLKVYRLDVQLNLRHQHNTY